MDSPSIQENVVPTPTPTSALRPGGGGGATLRPGGGLRPGGASLRPRGGLRPGGASPGVSAPSTPIPVFQRTGEKRMVYSKNELLQIRDLDICCVRPGDLPDMTIKIKSGGTGRQWGHESLPNQQGRGGGMGRRNNSNNGGGEQWARNKV